MVEVKRGQVWESTDSRVRTLSDELRMQYQFKVEKVEGSYATVSRIIPKFSQPGLRQIRLDRFKPNSTGYKLVKDVDDTGSAAA
jgi:hypothetical protein